MYAPRPQTHQIPRHYTHTATIKKSQLLRDKENTNANANVNAGLPSKTPSRAALGAGKMLAPNTTARVGLGGAGAGGKQAAGPNKGKGKEGVMDDIAPKRLFTSSKSYGSLSQSQSQSRSHGNVNGGFTRTPARGLLQSQPTLAPAILAQQTPLPSASKPRRSSRRSSSSISGGLTPARPAQAGPVYQTPAPKQWDEGNSLDSISEGLNELAIGPVLQEVVEEEEDGDPEYMPPHDEPLPYEPVGAVPSCEADVLLITQLPPLWSMAPAWSWGRGQAPSSPELERPIDVCINICDEDELEEPMFRLPKPTPRPASSVSSSSLTQSKSRPVSSATISRNQRPIPVTRLVKPPPPTSTTTGALRPRITKPPVPRLATRPQPKPAPALAAPAEVPLAEPVPDFDRGIMGETNPLFLDDDLSDLDFGFDSEDQVQTP